MYVHFTNTVGRTQTLNEDTEVSYIKPRVS